MLKVMLDGAVVKRIIIPRNPLRQHAVLQKPLLFFSFSFFVSVYLKKKRIIFKKKGGGGIFLGCLLLGSTMGFAMNNVTQNYSQTKYK